jgi:hypothetical protein
LEKRLQDRYRLLVLQHLRAAEPLTHGLHALPAAASAFATTQAAWRFYNNPRTPLPALAQPLLDAAHQAIAQTQPPWALLVHDQSVLSYSHHAGKADRADLDLTWGYELTSALLVETASGSPIAPLELRLRAADQVYSTRDPAPSPETDWLDEMLPTMRAAQAVVPGCRLVHVIDREGDSVGHYRRWAAEGLTFLVRAKAKPRVQWEGQNLPLGAVARQLAEQGAFRPTREVEFHGRRAWQEVTEAAVVLTRPAWENRRRGQARHRRVPGPPLPLRLVVSRVLDADGTVLAEWLLLTNLPAEVSAATVALWYYWRWRVESYFKLLKGAGQQLENWQQETAEAISRRLVVASMACVVVWRLARAEGATASATRAALVRLSGRQMGWGIEYTAPALLAGLWVLLTAVTAVEEYGLEQLQALRREILGEDTS